MASVNKCIFIGNLGRDPEIRYMPSGDASASFSIACTESYKDKNNQKQEKTEWVNIVIFGKLAEVAGEYLKKGSSVYIEGRLQTRKWQDKEGQDRYTTEIRADRMQMLGGRNGSGSDSQFDGGDGGHSNSGSRGNDNGGNNNRGNGNGNSGSRGGNNQQRQPAPASGGDGRFEPVDDLDDIPFLTGNMAHDPIILRSRARSRHA